MSDDTTKPQRNSRGPTDQLNILECPRIDARLQQLEA